MNKINNAPNNSVCPKAGIDAVEIEANEAFAQKKAAIMTAWAAGENLSLIKISHLLKKETGTFTISPSCPRAVP